MKNKLGILRQSELDDAETLLFSDAYTYFFDVFSRDEIVFDLALLFHIHHYFLSPLYSWAGKVWTVDISKDGMLFASVLYIEEALKDFQKILDVYFSNTDRTKKYTSHALAVIHCELNAIHPFREGNGRTIRLFLDLLATRAGYGLIDWSVRSQEEYIHACVDGMAKEYSRMQKIIFAGLRVL